jgi:hypothetical protein
MSECLFAGKAYRSRLEAKWSSVFTTLGLAHVYEPGTFALASGAYAPDFWMPDTQRYLEVKPSRPLSTEIAKTMALQRHTGTHVFFLCGFPRVSGFDLMNAQACWHDGLPVGPGMPVLLSFLYALGLRESPVDALGLVLAVLHAHAALAHADAQPLVVVGDIMRRARKQVPWPQWIHTCHGAQQEHVHDEE